MSPNRSLKPAIMLVLLTVLLLSACQGQPLLIIPEEVAAADISTSDVFVFGSNNVKVEGAVSTLERYPDHIEWKVETSELPPGEAYTVWWIIFNSPEACSGAPCGSSDLSNPDVQASVQHATGQVVGEDGEATFTASLDTGDPTGALDIGAGIPAPGLLDAMKAEIHTVIRTHGKALGDPTEQITTFDGGCNPQCANVQSAMHFAETAQELVREVELIMMPHPAAGMPEQDVYIVKDDAGEGEVMRAKLEEVDDPAVLAQPVYASTVAIDHDPFVVGEAPFGPFAKGPELGFTMEEWLSVTGSGTYTVHGSSAKVDFTFENLVPNGVYTLWCARVKVPPDPIIIDLPCGEPDGSENVFSADAEGNASISLEMRPLWETTEERMSVLAIAYHSDGNTYGMHPGDFGRVTHVQALVPMPSPGDEAWETQIVKVPAPSQ